MALWLIGLGIELAWNRPHHPQENGQVERTHGVMAHWVEPKDCPDPRCVQQRLTWALTIQREKYPAVHGQPRLTAYPDLKHPARPYSLAHEPTLWQLDRVYPFLAQGAWPRRVDKVGRITLYGWPYSVGRPFAHQEVLIRFDPSAVCWLIFSLEGVLLKCHPARELTQPRILTLDISKPKGSKPVAPAVGG